MAKGWFVTGASRGFGRVWSEAALARGDVVVATARDASTLEDLAAAYPDRALALPLDVTATAQVRAALPTAHDFLGSRGVALDVVVNNAGYGLFGMVEEVSEQQARDQFEVNVFGALAVTQAALPILRRQASGHLLQVSSIGGVHAFPGLGLYHASKWALEGFSQSLAAEVAPFGIHVTLIEPTGFSTDWAAGSAVRAEPLAAYDEARERSAAARARVAADRGDPQATARVVLELVDMADPPLRLFLGEGPYDLIQAEYARRLDEWGRYDHLARSAHRQPD